MAFGGLKKIPFFNKIFAFLTRFSPPFRRFKCDFRRVFCADDVTNDVTGDVTDPEGGDGPRGLHGGLVPRLHRRHQRPRRGAEAAAGGAARGGGDAGTRL